MITLNSHAYEAGPNADPVPVFRRGLAKILLAAAFEYHLAGQSFSPNQAGNDPWNLWWTCYRAQRSATEFGLDFRHVRSGCEACDADAEQLAVAMRPAHPDPDGASQRGCTCLLNWAIAMRRPTLDLDWPEWRLTVGMVKPGTEPAAVRDLLTQTHTVLDTLERTLSSADVRRLYPDAYGADYIARRHDYLMSAPVTVFVLLASPAAAGRVMDIKLNIRRRLGDIDMLRNHLHMPDSPGEAFADLDHLAGTDLFIRLYERHERDRAAHRLARYRALLA